MHNHIISNKPDKGPTWELYRLNSQNIDIVIPAGIDANDFFMAAYRNGTILAETMQPICTVEGQKVNAAFSIEKLRQLPDLFDLAIIRGDKHLTICQVRLSISASVNNCHAGPIHISGDNYVSIQLSSNGSDGLSAYQLAVEGGFVGSLEEWLLSLNGKDGVDGEITQDRLISILQELGVDLSYGVEWDKTAASSACTRIGNMKLHASLPIQSKMRGCLLRDDGRVNYYLDPADWSKKADGTVSDLTGTDGQVMVEIPEHYRKTETEGNMQRVLLSQYPLQGFSKVEKFYYAAYEAALDRTNNKLASVKNLTVQFRGANNNAAFDGTAKTQVGLPVSNINVVQARSYARNRGENWEQKSYKQISCLQLLYITEYADRNSQLPVNTTLNNSYRQGGLGIGITNLDPTLFNTFNARNPFIPCGHSNELGNDSGEVPFIMPAAYGSLTVNVPRYRGIENIFGHCLEFTEGYIRLYNSGVNTFRYTDNPAYFSSAENWESAPGAVSSGYISEVLITEDAVLFPVLYTGSSNTYFADQFSGTNSPTTNNMLYVHGGSAAHAALSGIFNGFMQAHESYTLSYLTARITYHPRP